MKVNISKVIQVWLIQQLVLCLIQNKGNRREAMELSHIFGKIFCGSLCWLWPLLPSASILFILFIIVVFIVNQVKKMDLDLLPYHWFQNCFFLKLSIKYPFTILSYVLLYFSLKILCMCLTLCEVENNVCAMRMS